MFVGLAAVRVSLLRWMVDGLSVAGNITKSKVAQIQDEKATKSLQNDLAGRTCTQIECAFFVMAGDPVRGQYVPGLYQAVVTLDGSVFVDLRHLEDADVKVVTGHVVRADRLTEHMLEKVDKFDQVYAVQASCGLFHMLVVTSEGTIYAIGQNDRGQLGVACSSQLRWHFVCINALAKSVSLPLGAKVVQVCCGANHSVAVVDNGLVYSWGANDKYQIGHQQGGDVLVPTLMTSFYRPALQWESLAVCGTQTSSAHKFELETIELPWIVAASCGDLHSAFLSAKGQIFVCGDNEWGQTGYLWKKPGRNTNSPTFGMSEDEDEGAGATSMEMSLQFFQAPVLLEGAHVPASVAQVACGARHTAALAHSGRLYIYGGHTDAMPVSNRALSQGRIIWETGFGSPTSDTGHVVYHGNPHRIMSIECRGPWTLATVSLCCMR